MTGRSHELKVDKTTVGRVEDNMFQIAESSVSSHHCEILKRGNEVVVKDLNSTNGTYINGEKITESVLKPGQTLRLGQVEILLESDVVPVELDTGMLSAPAVEPIKKPLNQTATMPRGVSLNELEQGPRARGFDTTSKAFAKKGNQANKWFLIIGIIVLFVIGVMLLFAISQIENR
jgi:pSer/pThr/pTyr-binding forkhead associated (FHA) protein